MQRLTATVLAAALLLAQTAGGQKEEEVFLWASSGGGWRAQGACMGYANVFAQAGLIMPEDETSLFSAISTQSGASWFSTQFFYSPQFFQNTTTSTPDKLYEFVLNWMNSYQTFSSQNLTSNPKCDFFDIVGNTTELAILAEFCNIIIDFEGDWAAFIRGMYEATSSDYGDAGLADRAVDADNRVAGMSSTSLLVQTALVANSRVRNATGNDTATYLGPSQTFNLNSIPLCVDWIVTENDSFYFTNQPEHTLSSSSWRAYAGETSNTFSFADWEAFPLYPADNGSVSIPVLSGTTASGNLQQPFFASQVPTVGQIGSASSAAAGFNSGLCPSTLAQHMSIQRNEILTNSSSTAAEKAQDLAALTDDINRIYQDELVDDLAVCTQWPSECGESDGRFIDGYVADELTLALNIGLYQSSGGDLTKTLRVILTNNAQWQNLPLSVLVYFNTTFNQGVEPGTFVWPSVQGQHSDLPLYSPQIFDSYLDLDMMSNITEPIEGMNVTTALISTTTIENVAFKTKAGQAVEILLLSLNSDIPTILIGETLVEQWKVPIADLARDIASSQVLLSRVESFIAGAVQSNLTSAGCIVRVGWILLSLLVSLAIAV